MVQRTSRPSPIIPWSLAATLIALVTTGAPAAAQDAPPGPAIEQDELPPAPPPAPGAEPAPTPAPAPAPPPAATPTKAACPLGQRIDAEGRCVDSDPDPWTEGDAPIPPSLTGRHTHDGFMLRVTAGLGGAGAAVDEAIEVEVSGGGWLFSLDIGGTIAQTLVLHGRLATISVFEPTVKLDGDEIAQVDDARLSLTHLGPALTYYIMPYNIYFTGSLGVSLAELEGDAGRIETDPGFGMSLDFGKEWWVAHDWGLGVAARLMIGAAQLERSDADAGLAGIGLLFTATYQ
ncbi:MAG: hypothetical protein OXT09_20465 [Myxococcales bacterium]|nr:hypothetical protein [Myxococcales bacterium]